MNRIFYLMGKSASGKDSLYSRILSEMQMNPIVLHTTRPMREHEQDGREYHFVDRAAFEEMLRSGSVIEERTYHTVHGEWTYFTSVDSIDLNKGSLLGIGTLESYTKISAFFGKDKVIPIYVEVDDPVRLIRAVERERLESEPKYTELCRRFIADSEDFSEEKLSEAGIQKRFDNGEEFDKCLSEIKDYIASFL